MVKVVRIPLLYTSQELSYAAVCKELWNIQKDVRSIKNKTIQMCWEWQNFKHEYSKEYGITPKEIDVLRVNTLRGNIDAALTKEFPAMYSSNRSTAVTNACRDFNNAYKKILTGEKSIIEYKSNQPIELHNKAITLSYCDNAYNFALCLFSDSKRKELGLPNTKLSFIAHHIDNSRSIILDRCISGEYKISESKLIYSQKKKQWFLNLSYTFKIEPSENKDPNKVMGVDLGIACVAYMSFNFCEDRYKIDGGEISNFRHTIERRKRELQRQGKYCGKGRVGHGVKTRIAPTERLNESISNFRNTANHKYSKYIVDMAVKHGSGTIQMEDIKGIAGDDTFLKEWTYFDLRTKIENKAKEKGITVKLVNPAYTSQRCSRCGHIDAENRPKKEKGQVYFKCISCGFEANADYNASQNLATIGIADIIETFIKLNNANGKQS